MKLSYSILFLLFISYPTFANQGTELTCYSTTYAPYSYVESSVVMGINIDLITEISKRLGIKIKFKALPWQRLLKNIASDKIECAAAFFKTSEWVNGMSFMKESLSITHYTLFIHKSNAEKYKSLPDFHGASIGVNRGFKTTPEFEQAVSQGKVKKFEVGDDQQSLQMLSTSRLQGVFTDYNVGLFNMKQMDFQNIMPLEPALKSIPVFLVFSKKHNDTGLINEFDRVLSIMKQDGTYQKIFDKYLSSSTK